MTDYALILTNNDLIDGSLRKDSLVVVPKNFTIHKSILFKKLGSVSSQKMDSIYQVFYKEIGCCWFRVDYLNAKRIEGIRNTYYKR